MNVYHKVLTKIYEITGGKAVDVDLVDLLKKEGFFSNIDAILSQLQDEGWVTEPGRKNVVRITHWGSSEAKRVLSGSPDKVNELERNSTRLLGTARELIITIEEFSTNPSAKNLDGIEKRLGELKTIAGNIRSHL